MGNLHSISKALQHVASGVEVCITSDPAIINQADRVVFPGVGAIGDCMGALCRLNLSNVILQVAQEKPFLGICLGLQALLDHSEENETTSCLGVFPGAVVRFELGMVDSEERVLKIPHMGWNTVKQGLDHPLWVKIPQHSRFYFVHSYYAQPAESRHVAATVDYPNPFACALAQDNIFAVQFHPEKSHTAGLQLLNNFVTWDGAR